MGVVCACTRTLTPVQAASQEAVIRKPPTLVTTVDPSVGVDAIKQELNAYLEENKKEMSSKLVRIFLAAAESPEKGLDALRLKICSMHDIDWTHFSRLLSYDRFITKMLIWKVSLSFFGFKHVCACVQSLRNLKQLTLGDVGLGHHNISTFAEALKCATSLTLLALTVNELQADQISILCPSVEALEKLEELNLDENFLGDSGCSCLSNSVQQLNGLTLLSLRYNGITHMGCALLLAVAHKRPELRVLMEGNDITEEDLERLNIEEEGTGVPKPAS